MDALAAIVRSRFKDPDIFADEVVQRHYQAACFRCKPFDSIVLVSFRCPAVLVIGFPTFLADENLAQLLLNGLLGIRKLGRHYFVVKKVAHVPCSERVSLALRLVSVDDGSRWALFNRTSSLLNCFIVRLSRLQPLF